MPEDAGVNALAPHVWVREMQTKLHRWAVADSGRRFDDQYNLVCDPAFLQVAWERVAGTATDQRWRSLTPTRTISASRRTRR
jgi:RNA-directed DNA polymerase